MKGEYMWTALLICTFGCRSTEETKDTSVEIETRPDDTTEEDQSGDTQSNDELRDIDEDGFLEDVDCDDWNPNIYPGAEELLNEEDDDCDGFIDGDGVHSGRLNLEAVAIYQGQPYNFAQECTGELERIEGQVSMLVTCVVDQTQERADQLLGGVLTVDASAIFVFESTGESSAEFVSVGGETEWDANGTAQWSWSSWEEDKADTVNVQLQLDALHLDIWMTGVLSRD